jgi:hypothetical protein
VNQQRGGSCSHDGDGLVHANQYTGVFC